MPAGGNDLEPIEAPSVRSWGILVRRPHAWGWSKFAYANLGVSGFPYGNFEPPARLVKFTYVNFEWGKSGYPDLGN